VRVTYQLQEIGQPDLPLIVGAFVDWKARKGGRK
jgi:hypothetical protein